MGQRSRTETVAAVFAAFLARRLWSQAELAREVGVGTEALRKVLEELRASGVPLSNEKDHPHVYWSVPKTWFPGGVLFKQEDVPDLVRQLRRAARSKIRDRLISIIDQQLPARASPVQPPIVSRPATDQEDEYVPVIEDAAAKKVSIWMKYFTASRGKASERHASVHVIDIGPPVRFIATCHRHGDLRWFRLDGVLRARLDPREPFRDTSLDTVTAFRAASLDGYKGDGVTAEHSFFVREPESHWVVNNLLEGMFPETLADGVRIRVCTSAVLPLARYVVGLGGAARAEDVALAGAIAELARSALEASQGVVSQAISGAEPVDPVRPRSGV